MSEAFGLKNSYFSINPIKLFLLKKKLPSFKRFSVTFVFLISNSLTFLKSILIPEISLKFRSGAGNEGEYMVLLSHFSILYSLSRKSLFIVLSESNKITHSFLHKFTHCIFVVNTPRFFSLLYSCIFLLITPIFSLVFSKDLLSEPSSSITISSILSSFIIFFNDLCII